jgi:hypothetical protein
MVIYVALCENDNGGTILGIGLTADEVMRDAIACIKGNYDTHEAADNEIKDWLDEGYLQYILVDNIVHDKLMEDSVFMSDMVILNSGVYSIRGE